MIDNVPANCRGQLDEGADAPSRERVVRHTGGLRTAKPVTAKERGQLGPFLFLMFS